MGPNPILVIELARLREAEIRRDAERRRIEGPRRADGSVARRIAVVIAVATPVVFALLQAAPRISS